MKIAWGWIPAGVVLAAALGVGAARFAVVPSYERAFATVSGAALVRSTFKVRGLKCVDTAERVCGQLDGVKGVARFVAFASQRRADISYDPSLVTRQALVDAIEGPVYDKETGMITFGDYEVLEVDGKAVSK
jgi:copper chaperone CopZ